MGLVLVLSGVITYEQPVISKDLARRRSSVGEKATLLLPTHYRRFDSTQQEVEEGREIGEGNEENGASSAQAITIPSLQERLVVGVGPLSYIQDVAP